MGTNGAENTDAGTALALQFEVTRSTQQVPPTYQAMGAPAPGARVRIRPVVRGKTGRWVRTGVSWRDLQYDFGYSPHTRAHLDVLRELLAIYQTPYSNYGYYSYNDKELYLDGFGGSLWRLLARASDAGVEFVPGKESAGPVHVCVEAATLALDLTRDAESGDGDATLDPVVTVSGARLTAAAVKFIGSPAHGTFLELG